MQLKTDMVAQQAEKSHNFAEIDARGRLKRRFSD
jgi:hypothetical protein